MVWRVGFVDRVLLCLFLAESVEVIVTPSPCSAGTTPAERHGDDAAAARRDGCCAAATRRAAARGVTVLMLW